MPAENGARSDGPITSAEAARRMGVTQAAVSNYRRRFPDFPEGTKSGSEVRYDPVAMQAWATRNGKAWNPAPGRAGPAAGPPGLAEPQAIDDAPALLAAAVAFTGEPGLVTAAMTPFDAVLAAAAAWAVRWQELPGLPSPEALLVDAAAQIDNGDTDLADRVEHAGHLDREAALALVDAEFAAVRTEYGRTSDYDSDTALAAWMVGALNGAPGPVLDPACGTGTVLCRIVDHDSRSGRQRTVHAADREPLAAWGAAVRLHARGTSPIVTVADAIADPVDQPERRFGGIAVDPGSHGTIDWIPAVLARLAPGGRAAVVLPARVLSDPANRLTHPETPTAWIRHLQAVVALPRTTRGGRAPDLALWIVRAEPADGCRFIRAFDLGPNPVTPDSLPYLLEAPPTDAEHTRHVPIEILRDTQDWTQLLDTPAEPAELASPQDLASSVRQLTGALPHLEQASARWQRLLHADDLRSVNELTDAGHLERLTSRPTSDTATRPGETLILIQATPIGLRISPFANPAAQPVKALIFRALGEHADVTTWLLDHLTAHPEQTGRHWRGRRPTRDELLDEPLFPDIWNRPDLLAEASMLRDAHHAARDLADRIEALISSAAR